MTPAGALPEKDRERVASQKPEVLRRVASALVLAAIALGAVIASPWTFLILVIGAAAILAWEWGRLVRGRGLDRIALIETTGVAAIAILVTLGRPDLALIALAVAVAVTGFASLGLDRPWWSIAGLAYTALPAWALCLPSLLRL